MKSEEHNFKPLKIERNGKKVKACQRCGALKIGEDTIVVDEDYVELSPLTSDPSLTEGRFWFRSDENEKRWSPDGTNVEIVRTEYVYDLNSIMGFTYLAEGTATDSWYFTANPSRDMWLRQYSTDACFQSKYNFHGSYAHWTADNTFLDVPNKAENVYGNGEMLSVSQVPDGTLIDCWQLPFAGTGSPALGPQGIAFDGEYLWICREAGSFAYKYAKDGTKKGVLDFPTPDLNDLTWDGAYLWGVDGSSNYVYQHKTSDGSVVTKFPVDGLNPQGLTWDGEYVWVSGRAGRSYKYLPDGTSKGFVNNPWGGTTYGEGMGYDGTYLFFTAIPGGADTPYIGWIYRFKKTDGSQVSAFKQTEGQVPEACTWDGKYLWCDDEGTGWVYVFSGSKEFDLDYEVSPA